MTLEFFFGGSVFRQVSDIFFRQISKVWRHLSLHLLFFKYLQLKKKNQCTNAVYFAVASPKITQSCPGLDSLLFSSIYAPVPYSHPILWPPDAKNWLTGKDPDAGKDWRWKEKGMTEDEMAGWQHWLNGHELEQALAVDDEQGSLACYSPQGRKESDTTEQLNWTPNSHCFRAVLRGQLQK